MLRSQLEAAGAGHTVGEGSLEVEELEAKWFHYNVYDKSRGSILKMVLKVHNVYIDGRKRPGRVEDKAYNAM